MYVLGEHILTGEVFQLIESGFDEQGQRYHRVRTLEKASKFLELPGEMVKVISVKPNGSESAVKLYQDIIGL